MSTLSKMILFWSFVTVTWQKTCQIFMNRQGVPQTFLSILKVLENQLFFYKFEGAKQNYVIKKGEGPNSNCGQNGFGEFFHFLHFHAENNEKYVIFRKKWKCPNSNCGQNAFLKFFQKSVFPTITIGTLPFFAKNNIFFIVFCMEMEKVKKIKKKTFCPQLLLGPSPFLIT